MSKTLNDPNLFAATVILPRIVPSMAPCVACIFMGIFLVTSSHAAEDWPTFLGPNTDSKSGAKGLIVPWPENGPEIVWQRRVNESYAIGSVRKNRFYQPDYINGMSLLYCLDSQTGKLIWDFGYVSDYTDLYQYNSGPRCSPIVDGDRVYIYGVEGRLYCLNADNGKEIWHRNLNQEYGVIQNFFGVGSTPIIFEDLILVMVGGSPKEDAQIVPGALHRVSANGSGIVALDKLTGKFKYKTINGLASYASLKISHRYNRPWCFALMREGLSVFHPATGKVDFEFPWRARILESVNASTPVVVEDEVFISETYGPGSALLRFEPKGFTEVWKDELRRRQKAMQTHWNTAIHHRGFLYGSSGRHEYNAELRCIDWATGKVMWSEKGLTRSSLLYVDEHLVCLSEDGTLRLLRANPEKYDLVSEVVYRDSKAPVVGNLTPENDAATRLLKYPAWAAPILSQDFMYVRGKDRLVCLKVIDATK